MPATIGMPMLDVGTRNTAYLEAHFCAPCLNGLRHGWHGHRVPNFPPFPEGPEPRPVRWLAATAQRGN